jgi:hypothetical protein
MRRHCRRESRRIESGQGRMARGVHFMRYNASLLGVSKMTG